METPATTTETAPAPAPVPERQKPGRKPLDPAARDAAASRATARKLAKKLSAAKSADEFWNLAEELAEKNGRKPIKVAAGEDEKKKAEPDPLDVPPGKGWPTPRQMAAVQPYVSGAISLVAKAAEGSRYDVLNDSVKLGELEISRRDIIEGPAVGCAALLVGDKAPELHPAAALGLGLAFVFGPPAALHAWEVFGPRVVAWWHGGKVPDKAPQAAPEKATGLKLAAKEKAGA